MKSGYRPKGLGSPIGSPPKSGTGVRGTMENRVFLKGQKEPVTLPVGLKEKHLPSGSGYPICVGDLVCKTEEIAAVYYRVVRMPGIPDPEYVWIVNADPTISSLDAKPQKVKVTDLEHARASDRYDP